MHVVGAETTSTTSPALTTTATSTTTVTASVTTTAGDTATTTPTTVWVGPPPITSTTTPAPVDNEAPIVEITSPGNLSSHVAAYDPDLNAFRAVVSMSATVSDLDDDRVSFDWFSSLSGYLGTGEFITARATDEHGAVSGHRIQVIVWVPSDTRPSTSSDQRTPPVDDTIRQARRSVAMTP